MSIYSHIRAYANIYEKIYDLICPCMIQYRSMTIYIRSYMFIYILSTVVYDSYIIRFISWIIFFSGTCIKVWINFATELPAYIIPCIRNFGSLFSGGAFWHAESKSEIKIFDYRKFKMVDSWLFFRPSQICRIKKNYLIQILCCEKPQKTNFQNDTIVSLAIVWKNNYFV